MASFYFFQTAHKLTQNKKETNLPLFCYLIYSKKMGEPIDMRIILQRP